MLIERAIERLADALLTGLGLLVVAAVCLNFANVVGRYVFGQALFGADEIQTYMMVWMAFLGAVIVGWRNAHLRMDVLVRGLPRGCSGRCVCWSSCCWQPRPRSSPSNRGNS